MAFNFFYGFLCVFGGAILLTALLSLPCITRMADYLDRKIRQRHIRRRQANQPGHYGFHQHPEWFDIELADRTPRDIEAVLPPRPTTPWPGLELDSFIKHIMQVDPAESSRAAEYRAIAEASGIAWLR